MGVDTKAIIRKGTSIFEIEDYLKTKYTDVEIHSTRTDGFFPAYFKDGKDNRNMSVFIEKYALIDYNIDGVLLSFGLWGNSIEIMKGLCQHFGGYLDENNCDDKDFYPINIELFNQGKEVTRMDFLKQEIIQKFSRKDIDKFIALAEKYKDVF